MRLFGESAPALPTGDAVADFWYWWVSEGAGLIERALRGDSAPARYELLSTKVADLDPRLVWEITPLEDDRHLLVITAEHVPEVRALARRWFLAAPSDTPRWVYADARSAVSNLTQIELTVGRYSVRFSDIEFYARERGAGLDLEVFHPNFIHLPDTSRDQLISFSLDAALGEDVRKTWVKSVTPVVIRPISAHPLNDLPFEVDRLRTRKLGTSQHAWAHVKKPTAKGTLWATALLPLVSAIAPEFDLHVEIRLPFDERNDEGFPAGESLTALNEIKQKVLAGIRGQGRLVAHVTTNGIWTLHFYVSSRSTALNTIETLAKSWAEGGAETASKYDPTWDNVAHLRP